MPRSDIDKHFELALRGFLDDLEAHLYPAQVIGIDFVAAYGDGVTFTDFLLHPNPSDFFSRLRDGYFKNNPSLMLVPGAEEFSLPLMENFLSASSGACLPLFVFGEASA